jgi:type IV pilus assembly protein PilO
MDPRLEKILKMPFYQRVLILVVLSLLIVAGYYNLSYLPLREDLDRRIAQNDRLLLKLQESRRIANNLPRFKAEYEEMQKRLELALKELPNKSEIPKLLTDISGLAKDNGLEVVEFKPENEVPQGFYAEVPVTLKLSGSYHQMALFCEAVSKLDRIVNIEGMSLSNANTTDGETILSISASAITYRFVENPPESPDKGKKKW